MKNEKKNYICENCKHFMQHYAKSRNQMVSVNFGHCVKNVTKRISPNSDKCLHFDASDNDKVVKMEANISILLKDVHTKLEKLIELLETK